MKARRWDGRSRVGVGILLAGAATWMLVQSALVTAAGDPSAELKTAVTHAGFAAKYDTMKEVTLHLHHALFFLHQVLIQAGVLHRDHRLPANNLQHPAAFLREIVRVRMGKEHRAINVESAS